MKINDKWQIKDDVSGLEISVIVGEKMDRLQIKRFKKPIVNNRDFFFMKDGAFDGTGSKTEGKE